MKSEFDQDSSGVNFWSIWYAIKARPKLFILLSLTLMTLSLFAVKLTYAPQYEARALVKIRPNVLLNDDTRNRDQSTFVKEEILNRLVLERVINELKLNESSTEPSAIQNVLALFNIQAEKKKPNIDAVIRTLRNDVSVVEAGPTNARGHRTTSSDVYLISLRGGDPDRISQVINTIINTYLGEKRDSNVLEAKQTLEFLELRVEEVGKNLMVANKKLDIFKSQYANTLSLGPMLASSYQTAKMNLFRAQGELAEARSQVREAKTALSTEPQYLVPDVTLEEIDSGEALALDPQEMLPRLRNQLARYETKYTSEHPDIIHTRREIERLEQQIADGVATNNSSVRTRGYVNPEWQRLRADHSSALSAVRAAQSEVGEYRQEVAKLEEAMQQSPKITERLDSLTRVRDNLEDNYNDLKDQLSRARIAYQASATTVGQNLRIIEPAAAPETPVGRSPLITQVAGLFVMLMISTFITLGLYLVRGTVNTHKDSLMVNSLFYGSATIWSVAILVALFFEFASQSLMLD